MRSEMEKRHKFSGAAFGAVVALFSMLAIASAGNIPVRHVSGTTEVPNSPQKVVVFDLASLDSLTRLGVKAVAGVPQIPLPDYLKQYSDRRYVRAGTLFEPDYETMAFLEPDLIIIAGRSQPGYQGTFPHCANHRPDCQ